MIDSMDIENVSVHFTDPTGSFRQRGGMRKGQNLQFALMDLVSEAENEISLLTFRMSSWSKDWFLHDEVQRRISSGVNLRIIGDKRKQVLKLVSRYRSSGAKGWSWASRSDDSGLFHIKAIMVDNRRIYIGSANFSQNAMGSSAEWGIIGESEETCRDLNNYVNHLIKEGRLIEV